jgi:hypothetical protein
MTNRSGFPGEYDDVEVVTATPRNLTRKDSGKIFVTGVADLVLQLPDVTADMKGVTYTVFVSTLSVTTGAQFKPGTVDKITAKGLTAADNHGIINTGATDAVGDNCTIVCDGTDWIVPFGVAGTWAMP